LRGWRGQQYIRGSQTLQLGEIYIPTSPGISCWLVIYISCLLFDAYKMHVARGYGLLTLVVLQRSESEVRYLLRRGLDPDGDFHLNEWRPNESNGFKIEIDFLPPLEFARGWPTGMKLLLDSGG